MAKLARRGCGAERTARPRLPRARRGLGVALGLASVLLAARAPAYTGTEIDLLDWNLLRTGLARPSEGIPLLLRTPRVDASGRTLPGGAQLDWLPPLETVGLGDDELVRWTARGWRHATEVEVCALLRAQALAPVPCPLPADQEGPAEVPATPAMLRLPLIIFLALEGQATWARHGSFREAELCGAFDRAGASADAAARRGIVSFFWSEDPALEPNLVEEVDTDGDGEADTTRGTYVEAAVLPEPLPWCEHGAGHLLVREVERHPGVDVWPDWPVYATSNADWTQGQRAGSRPVGRRRKAGVAFRAWAPRACRVAVVDRDALDADFEIDDPDFGWSGYLVPEAPPPGCVDPAHPHAPDCDCLRSATDPATGRATWPGYWSADVTRRTVRPGVRPPRAGSAYQYLTAIVYEDQPWVRRDPRAVVVEPEPGHWSPGRVYDHAAFDWQRLSGARPKDRYRRPALSETVELVVKIEALGDNPLRSSPTYAGAIPALRELADLGVNMINVGYLHTPLTNGFNHYVMGDPFAVRPDLLDPHEPHPPDQLKAFVREAHRYGIGVASELVFLVWGAGSTRNFDGWIGGPERRQPDGCRSEHRAAGSYHLDNRHAINQGYKGWLPDFAEPEVAHLLVDNARDWITHFGVDKFRLDSSIHIRFGDFGIVGPGGECSWHGAQTRSTPGGLAFSHRLVEGVHDLGAYLTGEEWTWGLCPDRPCPDPTGPAHEGGVGYDMIHWNAQWQPDRGLRSTIERIHDAFVPADGTDEWASLENTLATLSASPFTRDVTSAWGPEAFDPVAVIHEADPQHAALDWHREEVRRLTALFGVLYLTVPQYPKLPRALVDLSNPYALVRDRWTQEQRPMTPRELRRAFPGHARFIRDLLRLRTDSGGPGRALTHDVLEVYRKRGPGDAGGARLAAYRRWSGSAAEGGGAVVILNLSGETVSETVSLPYPGTWTVRLDTSRRRYGRTCLDRPCRTWWDARGPRRPWRHVRSRPIAEPGAAFDQGFRADLGPYGALILTCTALDAATRTCLLDRDGDGRCDGRACRRRRSAD